MNDHLLMLSGVAVDLAEKPALYYTLDELRKHWRRIDVCMVGGENESTSQPFENVWVHTSGTSKIMYPLWVRKKCISLHHEDPCDVMTVQEYPPFYNGFGAWLVWRRIHVPYMLEIHHMPGYPRAATWRETLYRIWARIVLRLVTKRAVVIRTVNAKETPTFLVSCGVPKEKIHVIPSLYIDHSIFKPADESKKYDVIFVGRLAKNKGLDLFVRAVAQAKCTACIVGSGPEEKNVRRLISELGLSEKITMIGRARDSEEVARYMNASRLLVMTSYNEGGPRVVVEAMACGVPVVATPVGIVPDILSNPAAEAGITDWNPDHIARAIRHLLDDSASYAAYRSYCIQEASRFERSSAIRTYAQHLHNLVFVEELR